MITFHHLYYSLLITSYYIIIGMLLVLFQDNYFKRSHGGRMWCGCYSVYIYIYKYMHTLHDRLIATFYKSHAAAL